MKQIIEIVDVLGREILDSRVDTIILTYMLMPCWDKVCQPYSGTTKLFSDDA